MYFLRILYSSLFLALHVSGIICTHPQEHNVAYSLRCRCAPEDGCKEHPKHIQLRIKENKEYIKKYI
jgi:hypothetical protein